MFVIRVDWLQTGPYPPPPITHAFRSLGQKS